MDKRIFSQTKVKENKVSGVFRIFHTSSCHIHHISAIFASYDCIH